MEHQNVMNLLQRRIADALSFINSRLEAIESSRKNIEELETENAESQKTVAELKSALAMLRGVNG